ncbi:MAG TPA: KTSC domain-containing protein [Flavipsychrobacter sp.]|nr:KTSC domain-containing protein [Flavipsychrobacter sp.]
MPSTVIKFIRYDETKQLLIVGFVSGWVYHYKEVPESIYKSFKSSKSKGVYFNDHVKDQFAFERIDS